MSNVVSNIIGVLILFLSYVFIWSKLLDREINLKSIRFYVGVFFASSLILINYFYINPFIRILVVTCILGLSNRIIFKSSLKNTIVSTVLSQLILIISDLFLAIFLVCFIGFNMSDLNSEYGSLFANIADSFIAALLILCPFVRRICFKIFDFSFNVVDKKIFFISFFAIISINILLVVVYYESSNVYLIVIDLFLVLLYTYFFLKTLETNKNNFLINEENMVLMQSLHQYEDMVDRQRVDNHENKNQLLIIKNMIDKKDKDLIKYVNSIIKDKKEDDEVLYTRVKTIPSGGLQGIIYQKMLVMKDEKILFSLDVSRDIHNIDLDNLSMDDNYRLCKIVGVLLDNAIEASRNIDDKCIMISLYIDDNKLIIDISNKFSGEVDIDRIDDEGYTSKGEGHGYGLSLIKKILLETNIFENERSIRKGVFKQTIKVKIKNT